jgi:hypothetical protein
MMTGEVQACRVRTRRDISTCLIMIGQSLAITSNPKALAGFNGSSYHVDHLQHHFWSNRPSHAGLRLPYPAHKFRIPM